MLCTSWLDTVFPLRTDVRYNAFGGGGAHFRFTLLLHYQYSSREKGLTMSLFSRIMEKLGLKKQEPQVPVTGSATGTVSGSARPAAAPPAAPKPAGRAKPTGTAKPAGTTPRTMAPPPPQVVASPSAPKPAAVSEVDVVKKLEALAAEKPMKLNWKTSISDLLFLLDIENSYEARKELAVELGCPPELMGDSAKMNTWLHKEVLRQIAQNGGNIPKELLD